jgi:hypothetical protein
MNAQFLLHDLTRRGIVLSADGDRLDMLADENQELHDSALFDVVVEVDFYDGRRLRIPQQSTPPGWSSPF